MLTNHSINKKNRKSDSSFMKSVKRFLLTLCVLTSSGLVFAQDDLLSMLEEKEEPTTEYAKASFKTTRVINSQSIENVGAGVLDMKISHRFGFINGGAYELFGLDDATIRIGLDYGISDRLMVGWGRSSFEKTYDLFAKYKILRQSTGKVSMPITMSWFASTAITTLKWQEPERENYFSSRMYYTQQLLVGRKFNDNFTLQLMPTFVHRNIVKNENEKNDVYSLGVAARQKLTKRLAINAEYFYVAPDQIDERYKNSFSLGFDIETGGHVFQLHFTNSTSMIERGYITETVGNWLKGDIHFGFNVSRVFTIKKR
jgi:hypothetical protein